MYAFLPSGDKARFVGREPTKTVLAAKVFVLIIAIEFCDGIVAYKSGCVGCMTNAEAGKLYSAATSPRKACALCATRKQLSHQMRPRTSRLGQHSKTLFSRDVVMGGVVVVTVTA